jgi:hypothetical protein
MALCNELLHCTIDGRIVMYNVMDSTDRCVSIYLLQILLTFLSFHLEYDGIK